MINSRHFSLFSDYTDQGGAEARASMHGAAHIDEETMRLIVSEHLLVDRQYLTLADEIGKG